MTTAIELVEVTKRWSAGAAAVDRVSFGVEEGAFVVLLGPSGCGKSTTLRIVAGLEEPTEGRVLIAGEDMTQAPPARRRVSMVFQSYALFPHLDVAENILFGLKVRKVPAAERRARLQKVAALVGLSDLLDRKPAQLSGGQRQRVALARAIIAENAICLMDEPLSNLDAKLRHDMRIEIRALQRRLGMTVVYVTHDQSEAMSMADNIILLRGGRIEQEGTPEALYERPETTFAADFIGTPPMNLLTLADGPHGATIAGSDVPVLEGPGADLVFGIRPEHIRLAGPEDDGVPAVLSATDYLGADTIVSARIGEQSLLLRLPGRVAVASDQTARLCWSEAHVRVFDRATGRCASGRRARRIAA